MSTNLNMHSAAANHAIDSRLDAIDRALLGLLSRHERIELVAQIETRLRESATNLPVDADPVATEHDGRDQTEDAMASAASRPVSYSSERRFLPRRRPRSRLAVSSGILGIVALALLVAWPFMYLIVSLLDTDEWLTVSFLGGHIGAVLFSGLLAVALGIAGLVVLNRHNDRLVGHGWAITGLCTGPLPLFAGGLVALLLAAQLKTAVTVTPAYAVAPTAIPPGPIATNPYGDPALAPPGAMPSPMMPAPAGSGVTPYALAPNYSEPDVPTISLEQPPAPDAPPPTVSPSPPSDAPTSAATATR